MELGYHGDFEDQPERERERERERFPSREGVLINLNFHFILTQLNVAIMRRKIIKCVEIMHSEIEADSYLEHRLSEALFQKQ